MKATFITLLILFASASFSYAQSIIYGSVGFGHYGGTTAVPYEKPFLPLKGFTTDIEFEKYLKENRSLSFGLKYAEFDKAELFLNESKSTAFYFGGYYNYVNPINKGNFFYEISPNIAYGTEMIEWQDEFFHIISNAEPDSIRGKDRLNYFSIGLKGSVGYKISKFVLRLSLHTVYDFLLSSKRNIYKDTQTGEKVYYLDNPKYQSGFYIQSNISIGILLFD